MWPLSGHITVQYLKSEVTKAHPVKISNFQRVLHAHISKSPVTVFYQPMFKIKKDALYLSGLATTTQIKVSKSPASVSYDRSILTSADLEDPVHCVINLLIWLSRRHTIFPTSFGVWSLNSCARIERRTCPYVLVTVRTHPCTGGRRGEEGMQMDWIIDHGRAWQQQRLYSRACPVVRRKVCCYNEIKCIDGANLSSVLS